MVIKLKLRDPLNVIFGEIEDSYAREITAKTRNQAFLALQGLQAATPKDTGRAASSWYMTEYPSTILGRVMGKRFQLHNTVPYIESLNMGHSKQAPPRFIEKTLAKYGIRGGAI